MVYVLGVERRGRNDPTGDVLKLAVISDLHLRHWYRAKLGYPTLVTPERLVAESIEREKPDGLIDAGDTETFEMLRHAIPRVPIFNVPHGNHDLYGIDWNDEEHSIAFKAWWRAEFGLNILAVPLWTDYNNNNPLAHIVVKRSLVDYRLIGGFTTELAYRAHQRQRAIIESAVSQLAARGDKLDIVITHHAPSYRSVHEMYRRAGGDMENLINYGFVSDMDDVVERCGAKFWIHGHVHTSFDYMIGETRVLCHPCGYPRENPGPYEPAYIEL